MKFKKSTENKVMIIQKTARFQEEDWNQRLNDIYEKIKSLRNKSKITIEESDGEQVEQDLRLISKTDAISLLKIYNKEKNKRWKIKDIEKTYNRVLEEEKGHPRLEKVNDGFQGDLFEKNHDQNLFFLHGSFHIYRHGNSIKKITQEETTPFIDKVEEVIGAEAKDVICIFANKSEEKEREIQENEYTRKCFEKLSSLSGNILILGSSLAENDKHIFQAINNSNVKKVYISSSEKNKKQDRNRANDLFSDKEIVLFDYKTISYDAN